MKIKLNLITILSILTIISTQLVTNSELLGISEQFSNWIGIIGSIAGAIIARYGHLKDTEIKRETTTQMKRMFNPNKDENG